jgi:hypothetical protein
VKSEELMFEQVCISRNGVDPNEIADALVYYGDVQLEVHARSLVSLCRVFGPENVCELVDAGCLRLLYSKSHLGVYTLNSQLSRHSVVSFSFLETKDGKKLKHPHDEIELSIRESMPDRLDAKRLAIRLAMRIVLRSSHSDIVSLASDELKDQALTSRLVFAAVNELAPGAVGAEPCVSVIDLVDSLHVLVPLDFENLNANLVKGASDKISTAFLLSQLVAARHRLSLSAERSADMWIDPISAAIIEARINHIADRLDRGRSRIRLFEDVTLNRNSFGAALEGGMRTPTELVAFVLSDETRRMKQWAASLSQDANLVSEYFRAVAGRGAMDRLPARSTKVVLLTSAGALVGAVFGNDGAGPAAGLTAGLALNVVDEFLLSRLRLGWRPNAWVAAAGAFVS